MTRKIFISLFILTSLLYWLYSKTQGVQSPTAIIQKPIISGTFDQSKTKSKEEWAKLLSKDQYYILQEGGTETPFTGELNSEKRAGTYYSHGCDVALFRSETKFDSGTGWPSFTAPITRDSLVLRQEEDGRIEVLDPCGGHLGHVFDDGPKPTGKRYCMNSVALRFVPDYTARFTIITNGLTRNFSAKMYHNLDEVVYLESSDPSVVHVKREGKTWGDFFATLPFKLSPNCLTTGTGETFCTNSTHSLKFILNDNIASGALDKIINPGDNLVVRYGSIN